MSVKRWNGTSWDVYAGAGLQGVQGPTGTQGVQGTLGTTGAQGTTIGSVSVNTWRFTATGGETSLTGTDGFSTTLAYTAGTEQVYVNGVLLVRGTDYTASNGTSITSLVALQAGDLVVVTSPSAFSVANAVPLSTVTTAGDLIVGSGASTVGRLGIGTNGQLLQSNGTTGVWASTLAGLTLTSPALNTPYFTSPKELTTVSATAATGTIQFDLLTQGTLYYTTSASGNFTLNFRGSSGTTLNSIMNTGDSWTAIFLNTNGVTPYYQNTAVTVDTSATVTVKWSGGTAPAAGNASAIDGYSYNIIKTGSSTFTVLCGTVKFA